jgi:hypothetical protein
MEVFSGCTGLTSLTLPTGLTGIWKSAFSGCSGLSSLTLPAGLTCIGFNFFGGCTSLTHLTLPAALTSIRQSAFRNCVSLSSIVYPGNAPGSDFTVFSGTGPGFYQYYLKGKTGFTSPRWNGYPAIMTDPGTQPAATWLLAHGQAYDANLDTDPNQDGVSLLMAYALNLDPRLNFSGSLPQATLQGNTLGMSFYAASPGLTYRVEASAGLSQWSTNGVTQSPLDRSGQSTATVPRSGPYRFLRLAVAR